MTLLSACLIVRNEAEFLGECLEGLRQLTGDIVVVDTGSEDETPSIARKWGCRVYHSPWKDDFSQARNEALNHARGQWALTLDADERVRLLCPLEAFETFLKTTPCQALKAVVRSDTGDGRLPPQTLFDARIVLFRRDPAVKFRRRVHEDVAESLASRYGDALRISGAPLEIQHLGYRSDVLQSRKKRERNIRLLQMEIADHGLTPWVDYCLGTEWIGSERWEEAIPHLERVVHGAPGAPFWELCAYSLAYCRLRTGQPEECARLCDAAMRRSPPEFQAPLSALRAAALCQGCSCLSDVLSRLRDRTDPARETYAACAGRFTDLLRDLWPLLGAEVPAKDGR